MTPLEPADVEDITALDLADEAFKDPAFFPPKTKTIIKPADGWLESTYYIVEAAFSDTNPVHRYVFFTGFVHKGIPGGYNEFFRTEGMTYAQAYYIKPLFIIAKEDLHKGAIPVKRRGD